MRALLPLLTSFALASSASAGADGPGTSYGAGVGKGELVKISELRAHPDRYVGKTVRVEGLVKDVCPRAGCWMEIASDAGGDTLRVKVTDGEIVFPLTARGKLAQAEGVFTKRELSAEQVLAMKKHEAEEKGVPFDEKSFKAAPAAYYQIQGTGAVIR